MHKNVCVCGGGSDISADYAYIMNGSTIKMSQQELKVISGQTYEADYRFTRQIAHKKVY